MSNIPVIEMKIKESELLNRNTDGSLKKLKLVAKLFFKLINGLRPELEKSPLYSSKRLRQAINPIMAKIL